ncbi:hypothetical protein TUM4261_39080 [Shewanella sp. c952]|nr:hypothetical protein TUM4261_39080 [Shewanella sp. c952]
MTYSLLSSKWTHGHIGHTAISVMQSSTFKLLTRSNYRRKKARCVSNGLSRIRRLEMTYSHMGKPHTTIGDTVFHF